MKMNKVQNFLFYLSKTDPELIDHCTGSTRYNQQALGLFVLFTGILAAVSGGFAVSNLFLESVEGQAMPVMPWTGILFASLIGLFYGTVILFIDREIVSAPSKWGVMMRVPLAIIIGLVIAVPLELKLLEGRIGQKIVEKEQEYNRGLQDVGDMKMASLRNELRSEKAKLDNYIQQKQSYSDLMLRESGGLDGSLTGLKGEGPVYREALRSKEILEKDIESQAAYLSQINTELSQLNTQNTVFVDKYQRAESHDFLSKFIALRELRSQPDEAGRSTNILAWGITMLLIFFELIPSLMKLLLPQSEYDELRETRRILNVKQTQRAGEDFLRKLEESEDTFPDQGKGDERFINKLKGSMM